MRNPVNKLDRTFEMIMMYIVALMITLLAVIMSSEKNWTETHILVISLAVISVGILIARKIVKDDFID